MRRKRAIGGNMKKKGISSKKNYLTPEIFEYTLKLGSGILAESAPGTKVSMNSSSVDVATFDADNSFGSDGFCSAEF